VSTLLADKRWSKNSAATGRSGSWTQRNEVLHMDWIYVTSAISRIPVESDSERSQSVLGMASIVWKSANFGYEHGFIFHTSEVMMEYAERCNMKQHLMVAYGHYNNGSIEMINKNYLSLIRALLSDLRREKHDWPYLNQNIEHTINHRERTRLNGNALIIVMSGLKPDRNFLATGKNLFLGKHSKNR
jgi:hypothetical protein